jgi:hypothetical protein
VKPGLGTVALVLLVSAASVSAAPIQAAHAAASPTLRSSGWAYAGAAAAVSCSLNDVVAGDALFVTVQSASVQQSSMTVSDPAKSVYSYISNWDFNHEMGAAYAQAAGGGAIAILVSVPNGGAGLSVFCYDIAGASTMVSSSTGFGSFAGPISVKPFDITPNSFVVAQYVNAGPSPATFSAGAGFTLTTGTPVTTSSSGTVGAEYGALVSSSTSCPFYNSYQSYYAQGWGGVCYALAPAPQQSDAVTAKVSPTSVSGGGAFTVSGTVTAGSGSVANTIVYVTVKNPSGAGVYVGTVTFTPGAAATANYTLPILGAGGTSSWIGGNYTVIATYLSTPGGTPATATASFSYLSSFTNTANFAVSAPAARTSSGGYPGVQIGYTSTYDQSLSAFVWVVARNNLGQAAGVYVGSATASSAGGVTVFVPIINLPPGNYNASVFATTTSSIAISQVSTVSFSVAPPP